MSDGGTRMLSARVVTKATPRSIHIVPSVMMNGCTLSPTTSSPFSSPQSSPTPTHVPIATSAVAPSPIGPRARRTSAMLTPASA